MVVSIKNLVGNTDIPGAIATMFTTSAQDVIRGAVACNHTVSTVITVDIYKVPSAVTAAATNQIYKGFTISAGVTVVLTALLNQVFDSGDKLQAAASVSASVSLNIGGNRIS